MVSSVVKLLSVDTRTYESAPAKNVIQCSWLISCGCRAYLLGIQSRACPPGARDAAPCMVRRLYVQSVMKVGTGLLIGLTLAVVGRLRSLCQSLRSQLTRTPHDHSKTQDHFHYLFQYVCLHILQCHNPMTELLRLTMQSMELASRH